MGLAYNVNVKGFVLYALPSFLQVINCNGVQVFFYLTLFLSGIIVCLLIDLFTDKLKQSLQVVVRGDQSGEH